MTKTTVVPVFISHKLNTLPDREAKNEFLRKLDRWRRDEFSEELVKYLEKELNRLIEEDEKETSFLSYFQEKYSSAASKGQRKTIRKLIKFLKFEE